MVRFPANVQLPRIVRTRYAAPGAIKDRPWGRATRVLSAGFPTPSSALLRAEGARRSSTQRAGNRALGAPVPARRRGEAPPAATRCKERARLESADRRRRFQPAQRIGKDVSDRAESCSDEVSAYPRCYAVTGRTEAKVGTVSRCVPRIQTRIRIIGDAYLALSRVSHVFVRVAAAVAACSVVVCRTYWPVARTFEPLLTRSLTLSGRTDAFSSSF